MTDFSFDTYTRQNAVVRRIVIERVIDCYYHEFASLYSSILTVSEHANTTDGIGTSEPHRSEHNTVLGWFCANLVSIKYLLVAAKPLGCPLQLKISNSEGRHLVIFIRILLVVHRLYRLIINHQT